MGIQDPGHRLETRADRSKGGQRKYGASTVVLALLLVVSVVAALLFAFDPRM